MTSTPGAGEAGGLLAALRNTAVTLVATARTRVELVGNELETERLRLVRSLILGLCALFCFGIGLLLLIALVLVIHWESRLLVLSGLGVSFMVAGTLLFSAMKRSSRRHQAFAATIAELEEDLRQLREVTGHDKP